MEAEMAPETKAKKAKKNGLAVAAPTPMTLIQLAVGQNADIDKLEKLMELQLRWEANEAKKAFVAAMNAFKSNPPEIIKNRRAGFEGRAGGRVSYSYASLDQLCDQVTCSLSEHGITHRWKVEQVNGLIRVTCILTHEAGHSEETTLEGKADESGAKNSIQAIGSTVTYLERYSLLAATGLAAKDMDTDGNPNATWEPLEGYLEEIKMANGLPQLQEIFKKAFRAATEAKVFHAMQALVNAKDARRKELGNEQAS